MSSSIGSVSFSGMQRPDPSQMASKLFAKLDTKNQGYIEKSDLQSALSEIGGSTADTSSVDDVFSQLDADSNGQVTKDEFSTAMKKVSDALDSQFNAMRMNGFGGQGGQGEQGGMGGAAAAGGMPPPPPGGQGGPGGPGGSGGNDSGFTKDELSSQLSETGSTDSQRSALISKVVSNFDKADSDEDGKVSFKEAMAYDQSTKTSSTSSTSSTTSSSDSSSSDTTSSSGTSSDALLMKTIMDLAKAYGNFGQQQSQSAFSSLLSVSA